MVLHTNCNQFCIVYGMCKNFNSFIVIHIFLHIIFLNSYSTLTYEIRLIQILKIIYIITLLPKSIHPLLVAFFKMIHIPHIIHAFHHQIHDYFSKSTAYYLPFCTIRSTYQEFYPHLPQIEQCPEKATSL